MVDDKLTQYRIAMDYLGAGDLDSAHKIAQRFEGDALADTIHAVVHRREGDFSNSAYWWRRVGNRIEPELLALYVDPVAFVHECREASRAGGTSGHIASVEIREIEILSAVIDQPDVAS